MRGTAGKDCIALSPATRIVAASPELAPLATLLADEMVRLTQQALPVAPGPATAQDICLKLNPTLAFDDDPYLKLDPGLTGLGQRITVSPAGILVEGTTYQAAAMASVTLLQSLQQEAGGPLRLPRMLLEDKPGSQYCGVMLDVARQWHPIEYLYEVVDLCRLYKVRFLQFHFTDDQGYPPLGCHGHPFVRTPHLDAFHDDGVRFEQFHSGTTCAPTRAGLLTGHHCNSTGVWHTIGGRSLLRRDEWSLAAALRQSGYRTGIFGKWHLGDEFPYRPQDRGFETTVCHGGGGISQQPDWWGNDYFDDTYQANGAPRPFAGYCTDVFFAEARRFIEAHRAEPFFCFISTNAPHSPFNVEPACRDLYTADTPSEPYARFLGMISNIDANF
jgi:hypothetical protein